MKTTTILHPLALAVLCGGCLSPARVDRVTVLSTNPPHFEVAIGQWVLLEGGPCLVYPYPHKEYFPIYVNRLEGVVRASELAVMFTPGYYLSNLTGNVVFTNNLMRVTLASTDLRSDRRPRRWHYNGAYKLPTPTTDKWNSIR